MFTATKMKPAATRIVPLFGALMVGHPVISTSTATAAATASSLKSSDWYACLCELLLVAHCPEIVDWFGSQEWKGLAVVGGVLGEEGDVVMGDAAGQAIGDVIGVRKKKVGSLWKVGERFMRQVRERSCRIDETATTTLTMLGVARTPQMGRSPQLGRRMVGGQRGGLGPFTSPRKGGAFGGVRVFSGAGRRLFTGVKS